MGREAGYRLPTQIPSNWGAQKEPIRVTNNLVNGLTPSPGATGHPEGNPSTNFTHARDADDRLAPPSSSSPSPVILPTPAASKPAPPSLTRSDSICRTRPEGRHDQGDATRRVREAPSERPLTVTIRRSEGTPRALDEGMNEAGCDLSGPGRQRMEHHHASTRHSFIEETVSPYRQSPHPVTRKGTVTAAAEAESVCEIGLVPPTCGLRPKKLRSYASPGVARQRLPGNDVTTSESHQVGVRRKGRQGRANF